MRKLDVDFDKLSDDELKVVLSIIEKGAAKAHKEEKSERELLLEKIKEKLGDEEVEEYYKKGVLQKRQRIDWESIGKKAAKLIKSSDKPLSIPEIVRLLTGKEIKDMWGGGGYKNISNALEGRHNICKVIKGKRINYMPSSLKDSFKKGEVTISKPIKVLRHSEAFKNFQRDRMKALTKRAKYFADLHKCSWEKALSMAHQEYNTQNKRTISKVDVDLNKIPSIDGMNEDFKVIMVNTVKLITTKGGTLSFNEHSYPFGIEQLADWHSFVADFMSKSEKICKQFGVENKFKVVRMGMHSSIKYEK